MKLEELTGPAALTPPTDESLMVLSYKAIRRAIGMVGIALPFVLLLGTWLHFVQGGMPGSISGYFYTRLGPYFVGTLCALGVFLIAYKYAPRDNFLSSIAGVLVIIVALCPTASDGTPKNFSNYAHLVSAATFFIIVGYMSGFIFTHRDGDGGWRNRWRHWPTSTPAECRNWIYRIASLVIAFSLLGAIATGFADLDWLFWWEALAVIAFSSSWLVKSGTRWFGRWEVFPDWVGAE